MKTLFQHACVAQAARLLIVAGCAGLLAPAAFAQAGMQPGNRESPRILFIPMRDPIE